MKIIPKEKVEDYSLPLPIYKSVRIADAIGRDGSEFEVWVGLSEKHVKELRELSADPSDEALQNFTGDRKRFVIGTYEYWYKNNRSIYALVHKRTDDLAAIIWLGPKPLGKKSMKFSDELVDKEHDPKRMESNWHTISIRSYPKYRGKGMMKGFVRFVMDNYKNHFPHAKIWAGMDDRNVAIVKLLEALDYKISHEFSDIPEHWLVMIRL
jgi:RimJ/RimL family protein N-acetyltransferase